MGDARLQQEGGQRGGDLEAVLQFYDAEEDRAVVRQKRED